jgi:hypothetical protein
VSRKALFKNLFITQFLSAIQICNNNLDNLSTLVYFTESIVQYKGPVIIYGRWEGKNKGEGICINKLLKGGGGLLNFFQENEGGGCH